MSAQSVSGVQLSVFVLSVSRDISDAAGAEVVEAIEGAGHRVVGQDLVDPSESSVESAIGRRLGEGQNQAVIVVGGASLPGADVATRAAARRLRWRVPGLDASFRALGLASLGVDALLSEMLGGITENRRLLFVLPDGAAAARLAADSLLLPLLTRLPALIDRALAAPAPAEDAPETAQLPATLDEEDEETAVPVPTGVSVTEIKGPAKDEEELPELASGWQAGLRAIKGSLLKEWPELPESIERLAPARGVLDQAGNRAVVVTEDGRRYAAFGFPDLTRTGSRVLLVRQALPSAEIIALHRHPHQVGLVIEGPAGALPSMDEPAGPVAERITGRVPPKSGALFAVDSDAVYLLRDRMVSRWDGRRETVEGPASSAMASLMLRWSQR